MNKKLKIKSLLFCCCLLLQYPFLHAQLFSQLSCGETWTRRSLTGEDIVVPQGANYLNIVLKGADGGDAWKGGTICNIPRAKGGGGAIVRATFEVGNGNNQLKPNGRLRIIVGQEGVSQEVTCLVPVGLYAGGGGSSAILYLPPERLPIDDNDRWIVLAIAGGGGGGHVDFVGDTFSGGGGRASVNGGSSHVASGGAYLECPEIYQNAFGSPPGAGGGLRCLTNDQVTGNRMNALGFGFPNDNIEVVLSPNRPASSTGGTYEDWPAGGNGFTGGGCGRRGGGGGGGIAGGAAHSDYGGGGGGSYFTSYIRGTSGSIQAGTDGGGIKSRGFVNLTPQADRVTAIANDISLTLDDTGVASIGPGDVGGDSFGGCGPITYTVNPNTFNCNDIGPNTVVFSMTDKFGNVSTASSVVTVEPPSIQVKTKNITRSLNSNGTVTISAADVDNGSSFSCGGLMDVSPKTFDCTQVGSNTVTLTVTDAYGFSSSATATVEIIDEEPPVVQPIDVTVQLDQNGQASVAYDDIIASVSDNCGTPTINLYGTTFDCSDFGENTVVIEAIDANGNDALYLARVNVQSTQVKGKDITVTLDANGTASITGADVDDGSSTVCGEISSMSVTPNTFTCVDIGTNTVLFMVSDGNGFSTVDYVTVTVLSNTTPQVKTKDITVPLDANGVATITAADVDDGSSVSCGSIASMTVSPNTFNCYNTGWPNTVTLTVTDTEGNVGTAEATVTVRDVTPPSYDCKDITVQLDASGEFTLSNEMFDEDGNIYNNDNCGFTLRDVYPYQLSCADAGQTLEVSLRLEDLAGNRTICTANVTVEDNTAPTAITKDITVQLDGNGRASITGTDVNNGSSDACGIATLAVSPNSFDCSQVGDNTVTLTVTDLNGNVKEADATVTVLDNVAPVASCPSNYLSDTENLSWTGESFVSGQRWQAFKVQNTGKLASIEVPLNTANPTPFPFPATPPTPITFKIYEGEGVSGTLLQTRTQMVILRDQTRWVNLLVDPALTVLSGNKYTLTISTPISASARWRLGFNNPYPAARSNAQLGGDYVFRTYVRAYTPIPVQLDANGNTSITPQLVDAGSSDACGIANLELDQTSFDCGDVGENIVTLSVKDINGNTSSCQANIRVEDHTAPKALTQDITVQLDDNGEASITPADVDDGSQDICGITSMNVSPNSFDCSQVGDNTVTLTVTDIGGNIKTADATVTIEDKVAPIVSCKNITVQLDENGSASITTVDIDNGSSDACGIEDLSLNKTSFTCSDIGIQTVSLTATDKNGNSSSCTANVNILDHLAPIISTELSFLDCINEDEGDLYEVFYNVTDNCDAAPEVLVVIGLPELATTNIVFEKKNKKKLQFKFNQNEIRVQAPGNGGAEAWWTEIIDQGGVAVQLDQQISLTGMDENNAINYLFDSEGNLKTVTSPSMTLLTTATDSQGNASSADFTAERQCLEASTSSYQQEQGNYAPESNVLPTSNGEGRLRLPQTQLKISASLEVFPNPFASHTNIRYHLNEAGQVSLNIFDLQGRLIQQLQQTYLEEGDYQVQWDGTDAGGYPLPAGMYLIQLKMGKEVLNKKVLLQR